VLSACGGPEGQKPVIRVRERATTADRHQAWVADPGKDHAHTLPVLRTAGPWIRRFPSAIPRGFENDQGTDGLLTGLPACVGGSFCGTLADADERMTRVGTTRRRFTRFVDHVSLAAAGGRYVALQASPVRFTFRSTVPRIRPSCSAVSVQRPKALTEKPSCVTRGMRRMSPRCSTVSGKTTCE
jgi:hypothetical protein